MIRRKKLDVHESNNFLSIIVRWYSPMAFFLLFFSLFWNGFLVVWYSLALSGDGPLMMALFPLLHVGVGVFLAYYTACLFFNKTYIDVDANLLTVVHKPLPWWKGNRKLNTLDIRQLYVKENKSSSKNGTSYTYALRAKMNDGTDKEVLALDTLPSEQVLELEDKLERFMGINETPVTGEYGKSSVIANTVQPRRKGRNFTDLVLATVYKSEAGDELCFRNNELTVDSTLQYDWHDGNTDKLLQSVTADNQDELFFVEQKGARLNVGHERELKLFETNVIQFRADAPLPSITLEDRTYLLAYTKAGKCFLDQQPTGLDVQQWHYISNDQQHYIRVLQYDQTTAMYKGVYLSSADFGQFLDLNNPPQRGYETRTRNWNEEEDLV